MRVRWPEEFPLLLCHRPWRSDDPNIQTLGDHPLYMSAKRRRSVAAALQICDELMDEDTMEAIYDACHVDGGGDTPIVIAPALTIGDTQNALATGYAGWLAKQMQWETASDLFQQKTSNRDFNRDDWYRLANEPAFYGRVEEGRRYVIADDVCTLGGTMASLRGFIESKGGRVICMTSLASRDGSHAQISLADGTLDRLSSVDGGSLPGVFRKEMGYDLECLTEHEGRFLGRCPSSDEFRKRLHGARNG